MKLLDLVQIWILFKTSKKTCTFFSGFVPVSCSVIFKFEWKICAYCSQEWGKYSPLCIRQVVEHAFMI